MTVYGSVAISFLPSIAGWQPDPTSLLIGLILGLGLAALFFWKLPKMKTLWLVYSERFRTGSFASTNRVETRFRAEMAAFAQRRHLGGAWATLETIFVQPRLLQPATIEYAGRQEQRETSQLYWLWPELAAGAAVPPPPTATMSQLLIKGRRVLLSGEHGSGKTTLLAYLALGELTHQPGLVTSSGKKLPVFVHLAELELPKAATDEGELNYDGDPMDPLIHALKERFDKLSRRNVKKVTLDAAAENRLLLLLDGWDDLSVDDCPKYTNWLREFLALYPDTQIIAAGPLRGYGPLIELGFAVTAFLPWWVGQAQKLGEQWRRVAEHGDPIPVRSYWYPGQTTVEATMRLILFLIKDTGKPAPPPERMVDLYEQLLRKLLFRLARKLDASWLAPLMNELWQVVAYQMLVSGSPYLPAAEIKSLADFVVGRHEVKNASKTVDQLIVSLLKSGLFVSYGPDRIGLLNATWRDYLAASHLIHSDSQDWVLEHLDDPAWMGVTRHYASLGGAAGLVKPMLESNGSALNGQLFEIASWVPEALDKNGWRRPVLVGLGKLTVDHKMPIPWRQRAALALAETDEESVITLLRKLLTMQDPAIRQSALAAIARLNPEDAILLLDRMSADGEGAVRASAIFALAWMDESAADESLISALLEPDEPVCMAAAAGFAMQGTQSAHNILREAATDEQLSVRQAAVQGLAIVDEPWSRQILEELSHNDAQWAVQSAAAAALEANDGHDEDEGWQATKLGEQSWLVSWAISQGQVVPVGDPAIPFVLQALLDPEPEIRAAAAQTLGQLAAQEARKPLLSALKDPHAGVRSAAFVALYQLDRAWNFGDNLFSAD